MLDIPSILVMVAGLVGALFLALVIGYAAEYLFALEPLPSRPAQRLFRILSIGNIVVTVGGAVIMTRGRSITLTCVIVACGLAVQRGPWPTRKSVGRYVMPSAGWFVGLLGFVLIVFAYRYFVFSRLVEGANAILNEDQWYYARLVEFVLTTHVEGNLLAADPSVWSNTIYHWGDIWHAAMARLLTGLPSPVCVSCISHPLLLANAFLGVAAIIEEAGIGSKKGYVAAGAFTLLAFGSSYFVPKVGVAAHMDWYTAWSLGTVGKLCFPTILTCLIVLEFVKGQYSVGMMLSMLSVGLYTPFALPVGLAMAATLIVVTAIGRITLREIILLVAIGLLVAVSAVLLYRLFGRSDFRIASTNTSSYYVSAAGIKTISHVLGGLLFQSIAVAFWVFIVATLVLRRRVKAYALVITEIVTMMCSAAIANALLYWMYDAVQFYALLFLPALLVMSCLTLAALAEWRGAIFWPVSMLIGLPAIIEAQHPLIGSRQAQSAVPSLQTIANIVGKQALTDNVAYMKDPREYKSFASKVPGYAPIPQLQLVSEQYNPSSLSVLSTPLSLIPTVAATETALIAETRFYKFAERCRKADPGMSTQELQVAFIKKADARWLIYSNSMTLPSPIAKMITSEPIRSSDWWFVSIDPSRDTGSDATTGDAGGAGMPSGKPVSAVCR